MKPIAILKVGGTFPDLAATRGDFEDWFRRGLGEAAGPVSVVQATTEAPLPDPGGLAGAIVTGSHAMVTDAAPWSLALADWMRGAVAGGLPLLGVCYGHQLLAQALGGRVDWLPGVPEVGTVTLRLTPAAAADPLLAGLPARFPAHATHAQSARSLPPGAVLLAASAEEPHHAFRVGARAWGVQFHPEFDRRVMTAYVDYRAARCEDPGRDWRAIRAGVVDTPEAASLLARFAALARG